MKTTTSDYLAQLLVREGITHVFTVPGGTALPLLAGIAKVKGIVIVVAKDEAGAAFAADGYAWASGKPGVVVTIGGPGATNAITGLCVAAAQGNPVVLVSGEVPIGVMGKRAAQDGSSFSIDVTAISRPATAFSTVAMAASEAVVALEEAFRRAVYERRPVHVSIPLDVQRAELPPTSPSTPKPRPLPAEVRTTSPAGVRRAAELLREGGKVAILVGRGGWDASAEILALAERLGAPVATTCGGKGVFPEHHRLSVGVYSFGGGPLGREVMTSGLEVLVVVGSGLGEFASMNYSEALTPKKALIHVDRDPAVFNRNYDCVPVCGDAREVCRGILAELGDLSSRPTSSWLATLAARHSRVLEPAALTSGAVPIRPERLMHEIELALPERACLVADIGTSCLFVAHCIRLTPPQRAYIPMAWSCMGHPLGAALGVRLGSGEPTVCVAGDAAFLAKGLELHAAVEKGVTEFVCIVLSNRGHGLVRMGTRAILGRDDHGVEDGTFAIAPNIAGIARAVGAASITVTHPAELAAAIAQGLSCGRPCVIDVRVDENAPPPMADRIQGLEAKTSAE